ncbi:MBG domain-containing protein, partial [Rhodonellum sp.]|uniref:MBG domain-containing protein n=1 Tax=Rhodonellum sp. TaxID=2231180 RepID=UPI0027220797
MEYLFIKNLKMAKSKLFERLIQKLNLGSSLVLPIPTPSGIHVLLACFFSILMGLHSPLVGQTIIPQPLLIDGEVTAIAEDGNNFNSGGAFTTVGGNTSERIAKISTTNEVVTERQPLSIGKVNVIEIRQAEISAGVPDAPTGLVITPINGGGMIQFTAPANDGGAVITNYEYSTDDGATWITPSPAITESPLIISSGLTNCTPYQLKLRAVNASGSGSASEAMGLTPVTSIDSGTNWVSGISAENNNWTSVAYGNGLFVAVSNTGTTNRVMTSPDAITWTIGRSVGNNSWSSVTYGNGLFVAVASAGRDDRVMTSPDGFNWTLRTPSANIAWQSVTYGNGLFVAVSNSGTGNRVMTSTDGITWTSRTSAADNNWASIAYGNGMFVAVATSGTGNRVMTSPDGISWTSRTSAADNTWNSVTYGNGLFVAVGSTGTGNRVMTSPDGITWTSRVSGANNSWNGVTYDNGLFVAVASTGADNRVITSPDGITWTIRSSATDNDWRSVTSGNGLLVAVANTGTGNRVMISTFSPVADAPVITAITSRDNAVRVDFTQTAAVFAPSISNYEYSTDGGSSWTARFPASAQSPMDITGLDRETSYSIQLRAINSVGTSCVSNSISATPSIGTAPDAPTDLVITPLNNGGMVQFTAPVSDGGAAITNYEYSTDDGATWITPSPAITESPLIINNGLTNCTLYELKLRAVNSAGSGAESESIGLTPTTSTESGITWISGTSALDNGWKSVTYGKGIFVAVANLGASSRVMTSSDGISWTASSAFLYNNWTSVSYGNGLFVAVANSGTGNRVMTSSDGLTWTSRTSAADNNWTSVSYGNGLFVAVANSGTGNRVMTSPDGINWTLRTSAVNNTWESVTYANSLFVAVGSSGTGNRVMTSPDGINWTSRTSAEDNTWASITYGKGLFVAVANSGSGNRVMTSPDGITWTSRASAASISWSGVTFGNGLFVAVSNTGSGNRVMTSPDGITWTIQSSATDNDWHSVTSGNGLFVAVANTGIGNRVMTSSFSPVADAPVITAISARDQAVRVDFTQTAAVFAPSISNYEYSTDGGNSWTARFPASTQSPLDITGLNQETSYTIQLRAINSVGASCVSNSVMATPSIATVPDAPTGLVIIPINNGGMVQFTAPANDGGAAISNYEYSTDDGATWTTPSPAITESPLIINNGLTNCTPYELKLRAVNSAGTGTSTETMGLIPATSIDIGTNWIGQTQAVRNGWNSVTYGNGLFVAVAGTGTGNRVMTSTDGITWTSRTSADNRWNSVTYGNGLFVAVADTGFGNRVMTSPDGITWTSRTSATDNDWASVTYGNGLFVAVAITGTGNRVMTSPDGINWTSRTSAENNGWNGVAYGKGLFVAVAYNGAGRGVMTSPDGITWTSRTPAANNIWRSITYDNNLFVAVSSNGNGNRVMTSPDGINWTIRSSAANNTWMSVTYGNGLFVAVASTGTDNRVMTSPNGTDWTLRTSASDESWYSVTYGKGLFVAVAFSGMGNRVMTSGYIPVAEAPVITSVTIGITTNVAFTQSLSEFVPAITNYEYSTDNGDSWVAVSPAATSSPLSISDFPVDASSIMLRAVNSAGSSCPSEAFTILNEKVLTIAVDADQSKVFGEADPIFSYEATGFEGDDNSTILTGTLSRASGENVGTYAIEQGNLSAGDKYSIDFTGANFTITPATIEDIDFENGSYVFDGTSKSLVIVGNLPEGTSVSYSENSRAEVGSQEVTATITGDNYTTLVLTANLEITPAPVPPAAPTTLSTTRKNGEVEITFTDGSDGGSAITNYEYSLDEGDSWTPLDPAQTTSPLTLTGLENSVSYTIQLRAVTSTATGIASASVTSSALFAGGTGTESQPYQIENWEHLFNIRNFPTNYFILNNDLNAASSGYETYAAETANSGAGWLPPSSLTNIYFDGKGYRIIDLFINREDSEYIGLFGNLSNSTIKNLTLKDFDVEGANYTGTLVGSVYYSDFDNVHVINARVTSGDYYGGLLIGSADFTTIINSSVDGVLLGENYIGGIVGNLFRGKIEASFAQATISGISVIGGLIGYYNGQTTETSINKSFARGTIQGAEYLGGLIGQSDQTKIINSYSLVDILGSGNQIGGIVGFGDRTALINVYAIGEIQGSGSSVGGLTGGLDYSNPIENGFWDLETSGQAGNADGGTGLPTAELKDKNLYLSASWEFDTVWRIKVSAEDDGYISYPYLQAFAYDEIGASTEVNPIPGLVLVSLPELTTATSINVTTVSATLGGEVTSDGGVAVTERGIVWSVNTNPTITDTKIEMGSGKGTFSETVTGLPSGSTIYVRAYATNSKGTAYGEEVSFDTQSPTAPTIASTPITTIPYDQFYNYTIEGSVEGELETTISAPTLPAWLSFNSGESGPASLAGTVPDGVRLRGAAADNDGNIYTIRTDGTQIFKITPDGTSTSWRSGIFGNVFSLHIANGYLYISRNNNFSNAITRVPLNNPSAEEEVFLSRSGGVISLIDKDGFIYAANYPSSEILKINETTKEVSVVLSDLFSNSPFGLTIDNDNNLFFAAFEMNSILKYDGIELITVLSDLPKGPTSIKTDDSGNFYISMDNGGIRKYSSDFSSFEVVSMSASDNIWSLSLSSSGLLVYAKVNTNEVYRLQTRDVLTGTPAKSDLGDHPVTLRATNDAGFTEQSFTITVTDESAPFITTLSPANNATNVALQPTLILTFDEEVDLGNTGVFKLSKVGEDHCTLVSIFEFDLIDPEVRALFVLSEDRLSVSLSITENLSLNTQILVEIPQGFVVDGSDNSIEGFSAASYTWTFTTRNKNEQTITFDEIGEKTYGDLTFTLGNAVTDRGLTVTYAAEDPTVVSISGNQATILKTGTTKITATQAGDEENFAAESVEQNLTVNQKALTVTADENQSKVYGSVDPSLTYRLTSGELIGEDEFTGALTRAEGEDVGNFEIIQGSLTAGDNYTIAFTGADFSITPAEITAITFEDGSFVYDGTAKSLEIEGTLPEGTSVAYSNNSLTNVGSQTATATITGDNYSTLVLTATLAITPATVEGITFENGSFVYDGNVKSLEIEGILPEGTSVSYADISRTDVGSQTA